MLASSSRNVLRTASIAGAGKGIVRSSVAVQQRYASAQATTLFPNTQTRRPFGTPQRHGPYNFQPDASFQHQKSKDSLIARSNLELGRLVDKGKVSLAFQLCQKMKESGVKPNLVTYEYLLQACANIAAPVEAWAVFEDMLAMGITPERQTFHHLMDAVRLQNISETWKVWDLLDVHQITPNEFTFEKLINRMVTAGDLETVLQWLADMGTRGLSPTIKTAQSVIRLACDLNFPRLAIDLAKAFEEMSVRRLNGETWMRCLISSAESLYPEGATIAWNKAVNDLKMTPDEGCCIAVLHTAGRHGLSELGLDALRILKSLNIDWQEHHFAPLVEAFCHNKDIADAFGILELMRTALIQPTMETGYPIFLEIRNSIEAVDDAWGILESMHEQGRTVDVISLNVVIQASIALGDLQRALGTYKAAADLGVTPSVDTYNLLLGGCIATKHRDLGSRLVEEMRVAGIKPDARTYERLIILCLTQATYEHAFFYLEEMKSLGYSPALAIYEAIVKKCVSVGDTRYKIALEEMKEKGYEVTSRLMAFVESGGQRNGPDGERGNRNGNFRQGQPRKRVTNDSATI